MIIFSIKCKLKFDVIKEFKKENERLIPELCVNLLLLLVIVIPILIGLIVDC
jgi:hypothetical protein